MAALISWIEHAMPWLLIGAPAVACAFTGTNRLLSKRAIGAFGCVLLLGFAAAIGKLQLSAQIASERSGRYMDLGLVTRARIIPLRPHAENRQKSHRVSYITAFVAAEGSYSVELEGRWLRWDGRRWIESKRPLTKPPPIARALLVGPDKARLQLSNGEEVTIELPSPYAKNIEVTNLGEVAIAWRAISGKNDYIWHAMLPDGRHFELGVFRGAIPRGIPGTCKWSYREAIKFALDKLPED